MDDDTDDEALLWQDQTSTSAHHISERSGRSVLSLSLWSSSVQVFRIFEKVPAWQLLSQKLSKLLVSFRSSIIKIWEKGKGDSITIMRFIIRSFKL